MDKRLKQVLKQSFSPPPSQNRETFITSISYPKASYKELLFSQLGFIRKRVWISFFSLVIFAYLYTGYMEIPANIIPALSALLPLFSLLAIMEIYKSSAFRMEEMEIACKYNLSKIILIRLCILGMASFAILMIYVTLASKSNYGTFRNVLYLSVPYLISVNASLAVITKFKSMETSFACGVISSAVSIYILVANNNYHFIFETQFTIFWSTAFFVLFGIMAMNLTRFTKLQEELKWN